MNYKSRPKYVQLIEEIKSWVIYGKIQPNEQIPPEHDLAVRFGMSRQTVRQAIAELVHQQWLYKVQGRGTFVSDVPFENPVATGSASHLIGVITTNISDYISPSIIRGIESRLSAEGYSILLLSTHYNFGQESRALKTVLEKQVDGLIIEPTKSTYPNPNLADYFILLEKKVPFVMLNASITELGAPAIRMDDEKGVHLLTRHLIELGHRRIGGIFRMEDIQGKFRLRGFIRALQLGGVPFQPDMLSFFTTDDREEVVQAYAKYIVKQPVDSRPSAVVCYNDRVAAKLIKELKLHGIRVAEDISVTGFDDDSTYNEVGDIQLTTIKHPKTDMGTQAAEAILKLIQQRKSGAIEELKDYVFEPELIIRNSTIQFDD